MEILRDGIDGFFGDDVAELAFHVPAVARLDRKAIRESVIERFSASRMADRYVELYRRVLGTAAREGAAETEPLAETVDDARIVEIGTRKGAAPTKVG
jgi:hypothetical protein